MLWTRGVSVLPVVLLATAVSVVVALIFSGLLYFYSSISAEPAIMPTYGSIYVREADQATGEVVVVNRFGYPVTALISIELNVSAVARDLGAAPAGVLTEWIVLGPGETRINVYDIVRLTLGVAKREYVVWSRSGILVGNAFFALVRGAGAPMPRPDAPGGPRSRVYLLQGVGTSSTGNGTVFSTLSFIHPNMTVLLTNDHRVGYYRSICWLTNVTAPVVVARGQVCNHSVCRVACCALVVCVEYDDSDRCTKMVCADGDTLRYRCDYATVPSNAYATYMCAEDGYRCIHNQPLMRVVRVPVKSYALMGATPDPVGVAGDAIHVALPAITANLPWEYAVPQEMCTYNYTEYEYTASFNTTTVCCDRCDKSKCCVTQTECMQSVRLVRAETRNACTYYRGRNWRCVDLERFLSVQERDSTLRLEVKQVSRSVMLLINANMTINYTRRFDPEIDDGRIRYTPMYHFELYLPSVTGFVSIPYTEELRNVVIGVNATVAFATVRITTSRGTTITRQLTPLTVSNWYGRATVVPVNPLELPANLLTGASKVFRVLTGGDVRVNMTLIYYGGDVISIDVQPICECNREGCSCSDSFRVSFSIGVILYPYVRVETASG